VLPGWALAVGVLFCLLQLAAHAAIVLLLFRPASSAFLRPARSGAQPAG
jgi:hypothetical protein